MMTQAKTALFSLLQTIQVAPLVQDKTQERFFTGHRGCRISSVKASPTTTRMHAVYESITESPDLVSQSLIRQVSKTEIDYSFWKAIKKAALAHAK